MSRLLICFSAFLGLCHSYEIAQLANYIQPKLYNLELSLQNNGSFTGIVTIAFDTTSGAPRENVIVMNSEGLEIISASIKNKNGKLGYINNYPSNQTLRTVSLQLEQPLEKSTSYELKITYKKNKDINDGYGLINHNGYLYTNFHPIYARRVLPCFDSPDKKAAFALMIDTPNSYVVSNMPLEGPAIPITNGLKRYTFKRTPYIPIHKLFFLTGPTPYTQHVKLWGNATICLYPEFKMIKFFNDIVNIANSSLLSKLWTTSGMEKLDILVVPELVEPFYSGHGIVVLRKDLMEYDLSKATTEMKREGAFKILEAILQVYYGSVVSPYIWEANWLSSSVSNYLKYLAFNEGNWGDMNEFMFLDVHIKTIRNSWNSSSDPVSYKHQTFTDTDDLQRFIKGSSVDKGSAVLSMMESFLDSEQIEDVFVSFLDKYKYRDGVSELNLFSMLTSQIPAALPDAAETILQPWVFEPSFPLVSVNREGEKVILSQESPNSQSSWMLPLSYVTTNRPKFDPHNPGPIWFLAQTDSISLNETVPQNDMIAVNIDGKSPYITKYEPESWNNLGSALRQNISILTPSTRAKLIADAFAMAKDNKANYTDVLHFLKYLIEETALAPWALAIEGFKEMYSWIYYTNSTSTPDKTIDLKLEFTDYVTTLLQPIFETLSLQPNGNDRETDSLRGIIIEAICYFEYSSCKTQTLEYYKKMNNSIDVYIPPNDIWPNLLCAGVRNADTVDSWRQIYTSSIKPGLQSEIMDIYLDVLGCSESVTDTSIATKEYLTEIFLGDRIPVSKIAVAYKSIYSKAKHINQALYFLLNNIGDITKIRPATKAQLLRDIAPFLSTPYHAKLLTSFESSHTKASKEVLEAIQLAKTILYTNQKFIEANKDDILRGLLTDPPVPTEPTQPTGPTNPITPITPTPTSPTNSSVTEPSTPPTTVAPAASEGWSTTKITLVVVGAIIGVLILGLLLYCLCKKGGCC